MTIEKNATLPSTIGSSNKGELIDHNKQTHFVPALFPAFGKSVAPYLDNGFRHEVEQADVIHPTGQPPVALLTEGNPSRNSTSALRPMTDITSVSATSQSKGDERRAVIH